LFKIENSVRASLSKTKLTLALLLISIFAFQSYIVFAQPPEGEPPPIGTTVKWRMLNETKKDVWNWTDVEWMYGPSSALEYRYLNDTLCDNVQRNQTFKVIVYVPFTIMNSTMFKSAHIHFHIMRDLAKEMADIDLWCEPNATEKWRAWSALVKITGMEGMGGPGVPGGPGQQQVSVYELDIPSCNYNLAFNSTHMKITFVGKVLTNAPEGTYDTWVDVQDINNVSYHPTWANWSPEDKPPVPQLVVGAPTTIGYTVTFKNENGTATLFLRRDKRFTITISSTGGTIGAFHMYIDTRKSIYIGKDPIGGWDRWEPLKIIINYTKGGVPGRPGATQALRAFEGYEYWTSAGPDKPSIRTEKLNETTATQGKYFKFYANASSTSANSVTIDGAFTSEVPAGVCNYWMDVFTDQGWWIKPTKLEDRFFTLDSPYVSIKYRAADKYGKLGKIIETADKGKPFAISVECYLPPGNITKLKTVLLQLRGEKTVPFTANDRLWGAVDKRNNFRIAIFMYTNSTTNAPYANNITWLRPPLVISNTTDTWYRNSSRRWPWDTRTWDEWWGPDQMEQPQNLTRAQFANFPLNIVNVTAKSRTFNSSRSNTLPNFVNITFLITFNQTAPVDYVFRVNTIQFFKNNMNFTNWYHAKRRSDGGWDRCPLDCWPDEGRIDRGLTNEFGPAEQIYWDNSLWRRRAFPWEFIHMARWEIGVGKARSVWSDPTKVAPNGAIDLDGDLNTKGDQYFVKRTHRSNNNFTMVPHAMEVDLDWRPNNGSAPLHMHAILGYFEFTIQFDWFETFTWYKASDKSEVDLAMIRAIVGTRDAPIDGYWRVCWMTENTNYTAEKAKHPDWWWMTNKFTFNWFFFHMDQHYATAASRTSVSWTDFGAEYAGLLLYKDLNGNGIPDVKVSEGWPQSNETTHIFIINNVGSMTFERPFNSTSPEGEQTVNATTPVAFGVSLANINGTLFPSKVDKGISGVFDIISGSPEKSMTLDPTAFNSTISRATIDSMGFKLHFSATAPTGTDLNGQATIKVDQNIGTWKLEKFSNTVLQGRSLAIAYFAHLTNINFTQTTIMNDKNSTTTSTSEGESAKDFLWKSANMSFAKISLGGSRYDLGNGSKNLLTNSTNIPFGIFQMMYQAGGDRSITNFKVESKLFFMLTCFPKWSGNSIVNDPQFTSYVAGFVPSATVTARFMQSRLALIVIVVIVAAVVVSVVYIWRRKKKRLMAVEAPTLEVPRPEGPPGPSPPMMLR